MLPSDKIFGKHVYTLIILLVMVIQISAYPFSGIFIDSPRDLYMAYSIATGQEYPLSGPILGRAIHFGPVWYYLYSIPLLTGSLILAGLWIGFLSALKFPLAYHFGKRLWNRQLGLLYVLFLGLPGWNSLELTSISHTNLVQTAVLGYLVVLLQAHRTERAPLMPLLALLYSLGVALLERRSA